MEDLYAVLFLSRQRAKNFITIPYLSISGAVTLTIITVAMSVIEAYTVSAKISAMLLLRR